MGGCRNQVHGPEGEPWCEPENMRCLEVPGSKCEELFRAQKEEAQKDG